MRNLKAMSTLKVLSLSTLLLLSACGPGSKPEGAEPTPGKPSLLVEPLGGFLVNPYLQNPGPDRMTVMFEPQAESIGETMAVDYRELGVADYRRATAQAESIPRNLDAGSDTGLAVYAARLSGLRSNTVYEYRVVTAAGTTPALRFKTWPADGDGVAQGRFLVISDVQANHPEWLPRIFEQGVIPRDCGGKALNCIEQFAGIIITGDLVNDGDDLNQWRNEYFKGGDSLFRYLPQLMIIGNHDYALANYLYYAAPPSNGTLGNEEEWYRLDYLNFRFLGMQSNVTVQGAAQSVLAQSTWFAAELLKASGSDKPDYLFVGIHAPCKSELWLDGESPLTCGFVRQLEAYSQQTGVLSAHLFGHTHGYSRGQSRDVPHLWMNAAAAGGNIDDFGDYAQADYDEFESTWDEYGYSVLEFSTQGTPEIRSVRRAGGDDHGDYAKGFTAETDRDSFVIGGDNQAPAQPEALAPLGQQQTADLLLHADYSDADGDALHEAHWQLRRAAGSYALPLIDEWGNETRARNDWFRVNLNAGVDLRYWRVPFLEAGDYCWRVRYRDARLAWSAFSEEACFSVADVVVSDNLLINGDAESGTEGWELQQGAFESLNTLSALPALLRATPGACGLGLPSQGLHWFVVGGCVALDAVVDPESENEFGYSIVSQTVPLTAQAADIAAGQALAVLRADLANNLIDNDVPAARLRVLDARGKELMVSKPITTQSAGWQEKTTSLLLPPEAAAVRVELTGLRQGGAEGDAYFDNVRLNIVRSPLARLARDPAMPKLSPGNGMALRPKKTIQAQSY